MRSGTKVPRAGGTLGYKGRTHPSERVGTRKSESEKQIPRVFIFSAKAWLWLSSPRNDNFFRYATQKTPRASDKQRRSALGYNLGAKVQLGGARAELKHAALEGGICQMRQGKFIDGGEKRAVR